MDKREFEKRNLTDVFFTVIFISFVSYIVLNTLVISKEKYEITLFDKFD